jgi:hypothetical protein
MVRALGIGIGMPFGGSPLSAGVSYDADALAYFAAMSVEPDATRKGLLNDLIVGLKADSVWTKITWLSVLAAHDAQAARINIKNPAQVATVSGSPVFNTNQGYAGDNTSAYLDSGVAGSTLTSTDLSQFAYVRTKGTILRPIMGYQGSRFSMAHGSTGLASGFCQTATASAATTASDNEQFVCASRTGTTQTMQVNTTVEDTDTVANSLGTTTNTIRFLGNDSNFSNAQLAAAGWGLHLNNTDATALAVRLNTYLIAIGALTVPLFF